MADGVPRREAIKPSSAARPASPFPYPVDPAKWWGPIRASANAACVRRTLTAMRASMAAKSAAQEARAAATCEEKEKTG